MGKFWLKIWIWIKVVVFGLLFLYGVIFCATNHARVVSGGVWFWYDKNLQTNVLTLVAFSFLAGVIGTILVRTTITTLRQIRDIKDRNRHEKMQRDMEEMKAKAAMLRPRAADETTGKT